ncbi:MAG: ribosomal protein S18-alanine N-acetyltransferase [Lachnospiraceae bacterium]|uniref:ribosomal protein S18-alanine N-acetyltransferase n=1 Tax=Roseburia hominis TaxID=301301 RepID=UPI001F3E44B8|nr:ribosomal protein S18-alanine N-acetyltransferase [Roseburia hominis]MDD6169407.1 ribosomal protein S18-alanine N-acetyltransferase [Lachnospiraceae bacterium]
MLEIKRMTKEHLTSVAEIEAEVFSVPWTRQGFADTLTMENVIFLVAEEEGTVVGYCGIYLAADEGEITNVAVSPFRRRKGIADRLLGNLLEQAKKRGIIRFVLEVRCSNEPAISLYEKYGFKIQGIRKNFYDKPQEDAYVMILEEDQ